MAENYELLVALRQLRQRIKEAEKMSQGRAPVVCDDEALEQIVALRPQKISDFDGIPGVGKTFVESYGARFLDVIKMRSATSTEKSVPLTDSIAKTLKELEKKLVNINRRNRLLYLPKISRKFSFDLFGIGLAGLEKLLFGHGDSVLICDTRRDESKSFKRGDSLPETAEGPAFETGEFAINVPDEELLMSSEGEGEDESDSKGRKPKTQAAVYRSLVQLLREVAKDRREKGQNDLYVGYPFAIGRLASEDFDIRAPLVLFPVIADKNSSQIQLTFDNSRDILFNNTLLLAHFKFSGISKPLPENTLDDYEKEDFLKIVLDFYEKQGISLEVNDEPFREFTGFKASEFPEFHPGELHLERCAVLGKFPACANSIQKDFEEILNSNEINSLLNELLADTDGIDYFADQIPGVASSFLDDSELRISEKTLHYVNELNSSQERVLAAIQTLDKLVIQGPPGTGKSQTIVSLIAQTVAAGKTVLMVSEKKTALDVVYSRLGDLSRYALLIDDVENKNTFYQQLAQMMGMSLEPSNAVFDTDSVSKKIETLFADLETIRRKLTVSDDFGITPNDVYLQNLLRTPKDLRYSENLLTICARKNPRLFEEKFDALEKCRQTFSDQKKAESLEIFKKLNQASPWLNRLRENLTPIDIRIFSDALKELKEEIRQWRGGESFLEKVVFVLFGWFTKRKINAKIKEILKQYFSDSEKQSALLIERKLDEVLSGLESYANYQDLKFANRSLSEEEELYFDSLLQIQKDCRATLTELNNYLFCALLYEHITKFEAGNREVFQKIREFDSIVARLEGFFENKRRATRTNLQKILADGMSVLGASKRSGEILRQIESKRKWSVNKFIQKFDFELFKSIKIWLMTPEVVSELLPLQKGIFDLVIFDEASQMYVERGVPSILRGKKVVVAGDHKQLRPSSLGSGRIENSDEGLALDSETPETSAALEEESLLDLARFRYRDILLNFHYRAKYAELIEFSNYAFYHGQLYVSPNLETPDAPPIEVHRIQGARWTRRSNQKEAEHVVELLKSFFCERKHEETVGVITFNTNQRELIEDLIDDECLKDAQFAAWIAQERVRTKDGEDVGLFVKNIESVQGDERDVVIFSIGYANNEKGKLVHNFGWLNQAGGENRLNVAVSRAKRKIYLVLSFDPSELQVEASKNEGPKIFKKYLEYAAAVSRQDQETRRAILLSFTDPTSETTSGSLAKDSSTRDSQRDKSLTREPLTDESLTRGALTDESLTRGALAQNSFQNLVRDALLRYGYEVESQLGIGDCRIDLAIKKDGKYLLGIECGSWAESRSASVRECDYHRQKFLRSRGWRLHRVWISDWWKNPHGEIEKIRAIVDPLLKEASPTFSTR